MDEEVKILCVDDEKNVLKALERLFLENDYEILTASSGNEGLEILKKNTPIQIVISDYRMPGMNGIDFLKEVCNYWPDTVRIVLSGYADTAAIVGAINEGQIYRFIPKPWNDGELKLTITNALNHYFTNQENIKLTEELEIKNQKLREINDNLEKLVKERTADLILQNKILTCSQNILDSLPVGVVGIDPEGLIAQCNRKAIEIFSKEEGSILGMDRSKSLPSEVNTFIDRIKGRGTRTECIKKDGTNFRVKGIYMEYSSGQEGIILVFDEENTNGHNNS